MNIVLPKNFNSPLKAINIIDFWKRWHITLTNFLMNYIYFPILSSRKEITFSFSIIVTLFIFLLAGFWHGPAWTFLFFGLLHGLGVVFNHILSKYLKLKINKFFAILLTLSYVNITFIFFRSKNLEEGFNFLEKMFFNIEFTSLIDLLYKDIFENILNYAVFLISIMVIFLFKNSNQINIDKFLNKNLKETS